LHHPTKVLAAGSKGGRQPAAGQFHAIAITYVSAAAKGSQGRNFNSFDILQSDAGRATAPTPGDKRTQACPRKPITVKAEPIGQDQERNYRPGASHED
jgi:hypothetical protein